jgi:hypothetical protein
MTLRSKVRTCARAVESLALIFLQKNTVALSRLMTNYPPYVSTPASEPT